MNQHIVVLWQMENIEIATFASYFFRHQDVVVQVHFNDTELESKLEFSKPINFLIHGWLDGLLDRNMYLGAQNKIEPNDHNGILMTICLLHPFWIEL